MSTPFDAALRVQRRAIDAVRLSLLAETVREAEIRARVAALDTHVAAERAAAAGDWQLTAHPYDARLRRSALGLAADGAAVDASLDGLRGAILAASGPLQAITGAADRYRTAQALAERAAEQVQADELSAARAARALRTAPYATAALRTAAG